MNILTFDIEEWYLEAKGANRDSRYQQLDSTFSKLLNELDKSNVKATFFCVGKLALDFPEVIRTIVTRGHEVGCHSNVHTWLDKMDEETLREDTTEALKALEDVSGQKVKCYRAPAFSITEKNKWAVTVLAECGIESDTSVFPATRDFGGYPTFPFDVPCKITYQGAVLKEYPVSLTSVTGKKIAYSGGGYFRSLPYWFISKTIKSREYNICYFHLADLINEEQKLLSRDKYESYFKEPGTLKNRLVRYMKSNIGTGNGYAKLTKLLSDYPFVNINDADKMREWENVEMVSL